MTNNSKSESGAGRRHQKEGTGETYRANMRPVFKLL